MNTWFVERFLTVMERFIAVLGKCWKRCTMPSSDAGQNATYTDQ